MRTGADDTPISAELAIWDDPTGWAVAMYSCTTARRMAVLRSSSILAVEDTERHRNVLCPRNVCGGFEVEGSILGTP